MVSSSVFRKRSSSSDEWVVCLELSVDGESSIKYQACVVASTECGKVDSFWMQADDTVTGQVLQWFCRSCKGH